MQVKDINFYDIVNYKKPSFFIITPKCSFKCDKECGQKVCQNSPIINLPTIEYPNSSIISQYQSTPYVHSIVFGGLEPLDTLDELLEFIKKFREITNDDIVIYTGYTEQECKKKENFQKILFYNNIIVKYGRFIPNQDKHYDSILGVNLASNNQYGVKYNEI